MSDKVTKIRALKNCVASGTRLVAGKVATVTEKDARLLIALKHAEAVDKPGDKSGGDQTTSAADDGQTRAAEEEAKAETEAEAKAKGGKKG